MTNLKDKIISVIRERGFITIDKFMETALLDEKQGYYRKKQPLGKVGDFITAPEVSQLFGEMIGLFVISWVNQNLPDSEFEIIELGAGKGTLLSDVLRVLKKFSVFKKGKINIIDVNEKLIEFQKKILSKYDVDIEWFSSLDEIKTNKPVIFIANEFFDALPVKQFIFEKGSWKERVIKFNKYLYFSSIDTDFIFEGDSLPKEGDIKEVSATSKIIAEKISDILNKNRGLCLIFDYGYFEENFGDSLQGLYENKHNNIFDNIGEADITYHVDFKMLKKLFENRNISCFLQTQRNFLLSLNVVKRAELLVKNKDFKTRREIEDGLNRLISEKEMGVLFKCLLAEKL